LPWGSHSWDIARASVALVSCQSPCIAVCLLQLHILRSKALESVMALAEQKARDIEGGEGGHDLLSPAAGTTR
jgi:hypothetical protein